MPAVLRPLPHGGSRCLAERSIPQLMAGINGVTFRDELVLSDGTGAGTAVQFEFDEVRCSGVGAWRRGSKEALLVAQGVLSYFNQTGPTLGVVPDIPTVLQEASAVGDIVPQNDGFLVFRGSTADHPAAVWLYAPDRIFRDGLEP